MLLIIGLILLFLVIIATISSRFNVPLIILALAIGIIFGSDVTGIIYFDDAVLAQQLANIALIFILFAAGFGTKNYHFKQVIRPTTLLATVGVLLTANIAAMLFCLLTGWTFLKSLLLCAIVSSTDAAAVFSILRTRSINRNIASITEIESATNDPMAIISTTFILQLIIGAETRTYIPALMFIWHLLGGAGIGILVGIIGSAIFNRIKNIDVGYFYVCLIGLILLSFGLADFCEASGMLSAFFAGYIMGNKKLPFKNGISSFTETQSFIANVGLFILLGLLVFPRHFSAIWLFGIAIFLLVTFVGRPLAVFLCTLFAKITFKEKVFLSWSGIRGAVPIVLATYPAAAGIDPEHEIFNIVFFAVTLSILVQGTTIGKLADLLKLSARRPSKPKQTMELVTIHETNYELIDIFIDDEMYQGESRISDMTLPAGTTITMVNRDNQIIAPSGSTLVLPGDTLSVLVDKDEVEEVTVAILRMFSNRNDS
ncbi:potassium/proton antiporter [candidate division WOR-3 bacterium]|nr:potassium/proton antiporter [candidate division WOR-3 bacterium]